MDPNTTSIPDKLPELRHRLSTRIVASSLVALVVVLGMIGTTLWLSWRLEGAGAAINDTGSLRMRAHRIAVELLVPHGDRENRVLKQLHAMDETLARLAKGNAQRPLLLPDNRDIRWQLVDVARYWHQTARPGAMHALAGGDSTAYLASLQELAGRADALVSMI
ncbi:MAG: type IV pili methyl-accepting chemotaxis transducer N-terminal domain-containing protein, partial [Burkholderiaceae bacterium]